MSAKSDEEPPDAAKRLALARERRKFDTAKDAAKFFGWNYDTYIQHERGERGFRLVAEKYAKAFRVPTGWLLTGEGSVDHATVQIVGLVSAGSDMISFADGQGPFGEVEAPSNATPSTVAVEARGDSLGSLFDGAIIFYDDRRDPVTADQIGTFCVVGLADGRVVAKKLTAGQLPGRYNLIANVGPPIYDAEVVWAAKVIDIRPK